MTGEQRNLVTLSRLLLLSLTLTNRCRRHTTPFTIIHPSRGFRRATLIRCKPPAKLPHFALHKPSGRQRNVMVTIRRARIEHAVPYKARYMLRHTLVCCAVKIFSLYISPFLYQIMFQGLL